ncbi:alanine--tRNA ligase [candidate division WS5 bacterium]|uniref:Alanine--tRNA ligase n=1 Tax=candidate division WS5 bacterium TaxID=2093353 RepID=A0A419DG89_9BACT|nr:MAG: alanine--tRNA ligase [candidate division WS5 bacterium]
MTSHELREKFLKFFEEKGHKVIPSASLIPENDPTVLFTTAGMHPLVPYLMGEKHPLGKRLTNVQKCIRTGDIDEVGDIQHMTFFEMLGYWSLGDYFKKESIHYTYDFYTKVLGIDQSKISVTVFEGDADAPFDQESYDTWIEVGIPDERIYKYSKKENWWGPVTDTGPCGPCTEMFVDTGTDACGENCGPACDCDKFVEIGNNVFMEYFKNHEGKFEKLEQHNVDVGLGFERLVMIVNGLNTAFETDLFTGIIGKIKELSKLSDESFADGMVDTPGVKDFKTPGVRPSARRESYENSVRIIADHLRAATMAIADEVEPSNLDRGYVVRRLIRRAVRHGRLIGIEGKFTAEIAKEVVKSLGDVYPELKDNEEFIYSELDKEEERFGKTLEKGLSYLRKELKKVSAFNEDKEILSGDRAYSFGDLGGIAFNMFQTYGFPLEMTQEVINDIFNVEERGLTVDLVLLKRQFQKEFKKHQELSRKGAEKKFKGGLGEISGKTIQYHTATHLLHEALRQVLGNHVYQKGSNITEDRLRFDFAHPDKMTDEEKKKVENIVNEQIEAGLPVVETITTVEEAKGEGATGLFEAKYGEQVKVYSIGGPLDDPNAFSKEICGGPHVKNTGELGHFKIKKEESSSKGVRRIKAVLE